ncbi:DUF6492 family protein [Nocardioides baculatus]|uniref:Uncharacterized protein n=1 Tax=Nocardioides baculatus TaxID=2801337 RepID=A0ABS1LA05_9ACTN|nr:DUF6492 family protein [Nocardioides baculatus]MBL0748515.1 hypothetical protein [Nocardioides baculatus]
MSTMAVLTPSFRDDVDLYRELHASVLRCTPDDVVHHVVVPHRDADLFAAPDDPRLRVVTTRTLLPRRFVSTYAGVRAVRRLPGLGRALPGVQAVNLRHPWPPVRGWVMQQVLKLELVSRLDVDVVLVVDSDVRLIRPTRADDFVRDGSVRFYCGAEAITTDMARHLAWQRVSRRLLGLPPGPPDHRDYIAPFIAWDPAVVRGLQRRIEAATGLPWIDAVARELHVSEFMLYGCFVENLGPETDRAFTSSDSRCRSWWETWPLDEERARDFVDSIGPSDLAVHVQSASHTSDEVRAWVMESADRRARADA